MKKCGLFLLACLGAMILSGCQSQNTEFTPLEPRLQPAQLGGAQTLVLINTSGRPLYDVQFRVYMWGKNLTTSTGDNFSIIPQSVPQLIYTLEGHSSKLEPGGVIHFTDRHTGGEARILRPVTRVQLTGSCDEGPFREEWQMNEDGQLRLWR
jgi:hypothetical protein